MTDKSKSPTITVGRYAGTPIDQLPNSYLRWMITQDFPKGFLDAAKKKLEESNYNDLFLNVSRHAIDMFSKRFLELWIQSESDKSEEAMGLASFIADLAQKAWESGEDISKNRHKDDGIAMEYDQIRWVFVENPYFPEFKKLVTVTQID